MQDIGFLFVSDAFSFQGYVPQVLSRGAGARGFGDVGKTLLTRREADVGDFGAGGMCSVGAGCFPST